MVINYLLACKYFWFILFEPFFELTNGCEGRGLSSGGKPKAAGGKNFLRSTFLKKTFSTTYFLLNTFLFKNLFNNFLGPTLPTLF